MSKPGKVVHYALHGEVDLAVCGKLKKSDRRSDCEEDTTCHTCLAVNADARRESTEPDECESCGDYTLSMTWRPEDGAWV